MNYQGQSNRKCITEARIHILFYFPASVSSTILLQLAEYNNAHWAFSTLIEKRLWSLKLSYVMVVDHLYPWYQLLLKQGTPWSSFFFPMSEMQLCPVAKLTLQILTACKYVRKGHREIQVCDCYTPSLYHHRGENDLHWQWKGNLAHRVLLSGPCVFHNPFTICNQLPCHQSFKIAPMPSTDNYVNTFSWFLTIFKILCLSQKKKFGYVFLRELGFFKEG